MTDQSLAGQVAARVQDRARTIAKQMAEQIGSPADAHPQSNAEIAQLWNLRNHQADPMQVEQMLAAGQHAQALDLVYPWRNKLIGSGSPTQRVQRAEAFARLAQGVEVSG